MFVETESAVGDHIKVLRYHYGCSHIIVYTIRKAKILQWRLVGDILHIFDSRLNVTRLRIVFYLNEKSRLTGLKVVWSDTRSLNQHLTEMPAN